MAMIAVSLLGPFDVTVGGRPLDLPAGPQRALLATLALAAPHAVPTSTLAERISADESPLAAPEVDVQIRRLRDVVGDGRLHEECDGWRLEMEPSDVDVVRFTRLVSTALRTPSPTAADLAAALDLWRGDPFIGVDSPALRRIYGPALTETRLRLVERLADVDVAGGRPDARLPLLRELAERNPTRESLWTRLLTAQLASGRASDALVSYQQIERCLAETLAAEPGPDLDRLRRRILETTQPTASPSSARPATRTPFRPRHQLPPRPSRFVGRGAELVALNELLGDHGLAPSGAQTVCTIHGVGGVGKTALALEWAHRVADRFPDGQLYLNLRGYGLDPPKDPSTALADVLRAVDVPAAQIPTDPRAQTAALRDRLASRRMLILLDNVRDADQVRPLLPGACSLVLVTSREPLPSLGIRDGARQLDLDGLSVSDARKLLAGNLPPARLATEADAVTRITERCRGLPLTLRIVGERAASVADTSLSDVADGLTAAAPPPDRHDAGTRDVHAVLRWTVDRLDSGPAAVYRRLGLHPTSELTAESAAAVLAMPVPLARRELDRLVLAQLLEAAGRGRYRIHDLLRHDVVELAGSEHSVSAVDAVRRFVDWCLHSVAAGNATLGEEPDLALGDADRALVPMRFWSTSDVANWFEAEHDILVAGVLAATEHELYRQGYQLAYLLRPLFHRRLRGEEFVHVAELGVECARYVDDEALAHALRTLGLAYAWTSRTDEAATSLLEAVSYAEHTGDLARVTIAISGLGVDAARAGDYAAAIRHHQQAVDASRRSNDPRLIGSTLLNLGFTQIEGGDCDRGIATTQEALRLFVESGAELESAWALGNLAQGFRRTLRPDSALELARRALPTLRRMNDVEGTAEVLVTLGRTFQDLGRDAEAEATWREAADLVGSDHLLTPQLDDLLGSLEGDQAVLAPGQE